MPQLLPILQDFELHVEELQGLMMGDTEMISPPTYFAHERTKRSGIHFELRADTFCLSHSDGPIYLYPRLVFDNGSSFDTASCEAIEQRDMSGARIEPARESFMYSVSAECPTVEGRIHIWHPTKRDCGHGLRYTRYRLQLIGGTPTASGRVQVHFQTRFSKVFGHHVRPHARTAYHPLTESDLGDFASPSPTVDQSLAEFVRSINGVFAAEGVNTAAEMMPTQAATPHMAACWREVTAGVPLGRRYSMCDDLSVPVDAFPPSHSLDILAAATVSNAEAEEDDSSDSEPLGRTLTDGIKLLAGKRSRAEMESGSTTIAVRQRTCNDGRADMYFMKQRRLDDTFESKKIHDACKTTVVPQPTVNTLILVLLHSIMKNTPDFALDSPAQAAIERLTAENPAVAPLVATVIPPQHQPDKFLPSPSLLASPNAAALMQQPTSSSLDGNDDFPVRTCSISQFFGCASPLAPSSSPPAHESPSKPRFFKGLEPYRHLSA